MIDENEVRELLEAVQAPPSRIDLAAAISQGRSRARRRRFASMGAAAATAVALVAVPASIGALHNRTPFGSSPLASPTRVSSDGRCTVSALPAPAGTSGRVAATAVDPTGRYVAGVDMKGGRFPAILWTDGKPQVVPVPGGKISAISAQGMAVGVATDDGDPYVFRYQGGTVTRLWMPADYTVLRSSPAVNAAGDIFVEAAEGDASALNEPGYSGVLVWRAGSAAAQRLLMPMLDGGRMIGIANDDTVVFTGSSPRLGDRRKTIVTGQRDDVTELSGGKTHVIHDGGEVYGFLGPLDWEGNTTAAASQGDWVVGTSSSPKLKKSQAVLQNLNGPARLVLGDGQGIAVNSLGWAIISGPKLVRDGHTTILPTLARGTAITANALSDTGLVVGSATSADRRSSSKPVVWQC